MAPAETNESASAAKRESDTLPAVVVQVVESARGEDFQEIVAEIVESEIRFEDAGEVRNGESVDLSVERERTPASRHGLVVVRMAAVFELAIENSAQSWGAREASALTVTGASRFPQTDSVHPQIARLRVAAPTTAVAPEVTI